MTSPNGQFDTMNDGADFWYYKVGVNVLPCYSQNKNKAADFSPIQWKEWQTKELDEATFSKWKQSGLYENGLMVVGGMVYRGKYKGQYLAMFDLDNQLAIDEFCERGLARAGEATLIEQHLDAPNKCHVYFYTPKPLRKKVLTREQKDESNKPLIEIKGNGTHGVHIVSPSIHRDGRRYEITSTVTEPWATNEDIEKKVGDICKKYHIPYMQDTDDNNLVPVSEMLDDGFAVYAGENRHREIMRYMESKRIKNPEFSDDMIMAFAKEWNLKHCRPPLDDNDPVWTREFKSAKKFAAQKIREHTQINELKQVDDTEKINKSKTIISETAALIKSKYTFVTLRETDEILLYNGKIYDKARAAPLIIEEAEKIIEDSTTHDRNEVLNKIKAQTHTDLDAFDSDANLVTLENGILDLTNLELKPHTPEHLSRVLLPVEYEKPPHPISSDTIFEDLEKNLGDTEFWQFLRRSFTVNGEFRCNDFQTVLEIMASPIIKRQIDEKSFMFLGGGENGKSVCLEYIIELLGAQNISKIPLQALAEDKFMAAGLVGKSANIFTDLEAGEMKHTGKIKTMTSGEGLQVQEKYQKPFVLVPFAKMMFSCNRFPKIYDQSQGFFRRWIIVKWERNFENDPERDPHLKQKLAAGIGEKRLVFSCLVHLAHRLNITGRFTHSKGWKETQKEWNQNADPLDDFVNNYIKDSDNDRTVRETYQFYKQVMLIKGEAALGIAQFSKAFQEYFDQKIEKRGEKTERVWKYIDFDPIRLEDYGK